MKKYIKTNPWKIIQDSYDNENNKIFESLMSLGNGHMGMRGNHEENFSGNTLKGTYIAGIFYPDKTKVGWWKNGYPEYFAKVLNSVNLIKLEIYIDNNLIDLNINKPSNYSRTLDMKKGVLIRSFDLEIDENKYSFNIERFLSIDELEFGGIKYSIYSHNKNSEFKIISSLDGNVHNEDSNYNDYFWNKIHLEDGIISLETKKTNFHVISGMKNFISKDSKKYWEKNSLETSQIFEGVVNKKETLNFYKIFSVATSRDYKKENLLKHIKSNISKLSNSSYDKLLKKHISKWNDIWGKNDINITGDDLAQQGIRFNIFHLLQTYHGHDSRLNIGPKGFTGEKYGGSTYWDTEAYCLPFYLSTCPAQVSKNLLIYRYNHLSKAIENATKLGLKGALYPMVTMTGEECHNEWEITFEEIHRNGAIAYAIYNYVNYTGDKNYLVTKGLEVLIEISRFWADRVHFSENKKKYVIHGVTGPNEYENNINNNWYTNKIAQWCLKYTLKSIDYVNDVSPNEKEKLFNKLNFNSDEIKIWNDIIDNIYLPYDDNKNVFLQQDGYLDKEQILVKDLSSKDLPLVKNWSWDKILRSPFIKQADVLQGIFFFEENFTLEEKINNFNYYEPRTVHESSLSPCIYSIIASSINYRKKAYELYLRTSRLDLEDFNKDTDEGLHITSMAGTWMSIIYGFAQFRVKNDLINIKPFIPENWNSYTFNINFRNQLIEFEINKENIIIELKTSNNLKIKVNDELVNLKPHIKYKIKNS